MTSNLEDDGKCAQKMYGDLRDIRDGEMLHAAIYLRVTSCVCLACTDSKQVESNRNDVTGTALRDADVRRREMAKRSV